MGICSAFCMKIKEKIIPAVKCAHGAGYQALIMVDNSQGHSAYSEDALLVSQMNVYPGGEQTQMHDGWFIQPTTQHTQMLQRASKLFLQSVAFIKTICEENARNAHQILR